MSQAEKTEKATSYKLQKQKEKGQVAKSAEFNSAITLLSGLIVFSALWSGQLETIKALLKQLLISSGQLHFSLNNIQQLFNHMLTQLITLFLPISLAIVITVVFTTILQTGFVWSAAALKLDMKRLNIIQGVKRYFSLKLLFDGGKNSVKFILLCVCFAISLKHQLPRLLKLSLVSPANYPDELTSIGLTVSFHLFIVLLSLSLIDYLFTRWKYAKDNRMSKQEVKDEHKQREGCPKIKAKIKQLQQEMRKRSASIANVKQADVLITNPTHLAIGLQYKRGEMPAPKVICKASGELALEAKRVARKHGVTVVENKPYARALFRSVQLEQFISEDFYPVAASIFRQIYADKHAGGSV